MGQMTRHVTDAGSYAPVTIFIQEMPGGGTRVAYDTVASAIAPYHDAAASEVAEQLDTEVLGLLRQVTEISFRTRVRTAACVARVRYQHSSPTSL
jgi:hypothetical protein